MAESTPDGRLTNSQVVLLSSNISAVNMRKIALGYMDLSKEVVRNIAAKNQDDQEGFTRDVLEKWKNKPQNSNHNQVKKLASLLFQAADEGSYLDPDKIQQILRVSREDLLAGLSDAPVTEMELSELAEKLRPITEGRTNIDMIQWAENNTVKMEDLYTELKIDRLENKPVGVRSIAVKDYKELFTVDSTEKVKGKRVLGKGDPGNGKTTFAKKVIWDWAKGNLKDFSLVFFVSMKLVEEGDLIEGMIIQQAPELAGLKITEQKLKDILEAFGSRCLVILDGYDEHISHGNKPNADVIKLLKGQKLLSCNVLVTSRPHSIADLEKYFSTIVNIQGFTEKHAREFASRVLIDKDKISLIMEIQCLNAGEYIREGNSVFTCPLLLLFICVLVNRDEIDLTRKEVTLGEIYTRLVRCLYKKYTIRKGIAFEQCEFVEVLKRVGFFAKKMLFDVRIVLQRSDVISIVGEDAFDYGLLIGHEDSRLSGEETADITISFPHRTIQEFLGALFYILMFDSGKSIEDGVFFMKMPLSFHFCLWFLGKYCTDELFYLQKKDEIYGQIETFTITRINSIQFELESVAHAYPALNIDAAQKDELVQRFVQKTLSKCKKIKRLLLQMRNPIGHIMRTMQPLLPQLSSIEISHKLENARFCSEELHIAIGPDSLSDADELLAHCKGFDKPLSIYFFVRESKDLSKYLTTNISSLHIAAGSLMANCLSGLHRIPYSPHLTRLYLSNQTLDEDFARALSNLVEKGNLPNLRLLRLCQCDIKGKLHLLFQSKWPKLTHLDLSGCFLDESDICVLRNIKGLLPNLTSLMLFLYETNGNGAMTDIGKAAMSYFFNSNKVRLRFPRHIALFDLFESPLPNMTELRLDSMNKEEYKKLIAALNRRHLPKLKELGISMWKHVDENKMKDFVYIVDLDDGTQFEVTEQRDMIEWLPPVNVSTLTDLTLNRFICTMYHLDMATQSKVLTKLHKLDFSHSSGITGTLSILLCHSFPSLNSLILSDCGLNSEDLCSLAQAREKGRLPELRHLDISGNDGIKGKYKDLFSYDAQWENLCSLNASNYSRGYWFKESYMFCIHNVESSNELVMSESMNFLFQPGDRCWRNVQEIYFYFDMKYGNKIQICEILDALEKGLLPALNRVTLRRTEDQNLMSMLHSLLVNLLPDNVIERVMEYAEEFLEYRFAQHFMAVSDDRNKKVYSGEGHIPDVTMYRKSVETFDMSSIRCLAEDEGLSESQTKELIEAIRTCLHIELAALILNRIIHECQQFRKYGVHCEYP